MGVHDVPFKDLTPEEKWIVYHGPAEKKHILYINPKTQQSTELDFTYYNANYTVENALAKVKDEKGMKRLERFLKEGVCPDCHGSRMSEATRAPRLRGIGLDQASQMTLDDLVVWVQGVPASLPEEMRPMAQSICEAFLDTAKRLRDLGLGYLSLDRASGTLSTGERQQVQLARAVRNRTTGVLYVLDEPSIGLHPYNLQGLTAVLDDLVADGNSVVLVDHDTQVLCHSQYLLEMGPGAGADGGKLVAQGTVAELEQNPQSLIGPYLQKEEKPHLLPPGMPLKELLCQGPPALATDHSTRRPRDVKSRWAKAFSRWHHGVSGPGRPLRPESLIPALKAAIEGTPLPAHVKSVEAPGISQVKLIDDTPIGINVRSTVATYAGIHDELRKVYARTEDAKALGYKAGDFSYNTGKLRCPTCDGTGQISLDVQFLPDVDIPCPTARALPQQVRCSHAIHRRPATA